MARLQRRDRARRVYVGPADGLYLPGYPLVAAGLLGLLRDRREGSYRALIIAVGCGALSWVFLIAPYVRDAELTFAERAMSVTYPGRRLEATADRITRLANRRQWKREIAQRLATADRTGSPLSQAMIDLDHFKRHDDTHGHDAGDLLLSACARAWEQVLRPADLLARVGGEEFALALSDCLLRRRRAVELLGVRA